MELGALICTPRAPKCQLCPVSRLCRAFQNGRINEFPNLGKRSAPTARRFAAFILEKQGRFLVRQRPGGVVNAHLWEFPNVELTSTWNLREAVRSTLGIKGHCLKPECTIKHSITRYWITLEVYRVALDDWRTLKKEAGKWFTFKQLEPLAFTAAHRKILAKLIAKVEEHR